MTVVLPLLTNLVAALLTLFILSRIIGDNPLFRVAQYLFVGVSLGYGFVVLYHQVLRPTVLRIATTGLEQPIVAVFLLVPFVLALLFLPRVFGLQQLSWLANIPLALIFGVGSALALVGALAGTIVPQILATLPRGGDPLQLAGGVLLALGVIVTLSYFYFTVPSQSPAGRLVGGMARVGRWLLVIAFGFFFAGALLTYLTALSERMTFLINLFQV
jgi:hypothetical protein